MLLTEIPGHDLRLRLQTPVMGPEFGFDNIFRVGEVLTFDATRLAEGAGEEVDPQVRQLIDQNTFKLIRLPLNIRPNPKTSVRFLAVEITLDQPGTTCWSLDPERVEEELKVTSSLKLSGSLKPKIVEISASHESSTEFIVRTPRIMGFGIGLSEFAWEFTPTPGHPLSGVQMLHSVVKSSLGSSTNGYVRIRADLVTHGMLWNTQAVNPDDSTDVANFQLSSLFLIPLMPQAGFRQDRRVLGRPGLGCWDATCPCLRRYLTCQKLLPPATSARSASPGNSATAQPKR